jgi:hypothetical protein
VYACFDNFIFYFPKVTSILRHPWQTKFRGNLKSPGYLSEGYLMIKVMLHGNKIWYLYQTPEGKKTIGLTLIKSGSSGSGYGE